jgi:signal transduction histidine kinase
MKFRDFALDWDLPPQLGETMKVRLLSRDPALHRLCRDVLLQFQGCEWDFGMVSCPDEACVADVCIWDIVPDLLVKKLNFDQDKMNIFLLDRQHVVAFLEALPVAAMNIVLKPVNDRVLRDFIDFVVERQELRCGRVDAERLGQLQIERDEILQSLLYSNLKLQEFDQDRMSFLANCIHDFRSPLMAVDGYCSVLLNKQPGPLNSEQGRILERMQHSARRLTRLTASMFEMTVGRRIHAAPPVKAGDIESCISQAVYESTILTDAKEIVLEVETIKPTGPILLEPCQIVQVLVNLLENACRFTPKRGRIELHARPVFWDRRSSAMTEQLAHEDRRGGFSKEANAFRIEVRDSGLGIRTEDLERIFNEYSSESAKAEQPRAGLGLSICRQIIQSHRGRILAESSEKGARFVIFLPYAAPKVTHQTINSAPVVSLRAHVAREA